MNDDSSRSKFAPHPFIVIEGMDGSGKTTIAHKLSQQIHAKFFHTPPPGFTSFRHHIDDTAEIKSRFLFYLCSVAYASAAITEILNNRSVVCDRYIVSTVAYHRALGIDLNWNFDELKLAKPNHTFFLHVDDQVRRRRLAQRKKTSDSDRLLEDAVFSGKLLAEFRKFRMIEIDTSALTISQVLGKVKEYLA